MVIWVIVLLVLGFALATGTALVRGLFAFYKDGEVLKNGSDDLDLRRGKQQNRMMAQRVFFQGLAIFAVVLLGAFAADA